MSRALVQRDELRSDNYKWLALISVSVGTFMSTLDASIVNIALPTIASDFHIGLPTVQWVVMSYLLVITSILLTMGHLGDLIGRKRLYMIGVVVFVLGSVVCGAAFSATSLILARAGQGLGAAMIMAMGPAITTEAFPSNQRGRALGIIGSVVAMGLTMGPALGGYIVTFANWRWIFFINLPIGIVGLVLLQVFLKESSIKNDGSFDLPGAFLVFVSLVALLLALTHGEDWRWGSARVIMLFITFIVFLIAFIRWETRTKSPIFHLELLSNRVFTIASITAWISYVALFAVSLYMSFYLQRILKLSPLDAGHILLIFPLTVTLIAPASGWLSDHVGSRVPASLGLGVSVVGLLLLARLKIDSTPMDALWRIVVVGLGSGAFQSPNSSSIMGSVPKSMLGVASGTVAMMRNLGMVCGVAITGAVITSAEASFLIRNPHANNQAFVYGLGWGFNVAAAIAIVGVIFSALREPISLERNNSD